MRSFSLMSREKWITTRPTGRWALDLELRGKRALVTGGEVHGLIVDTRDDASVDGLIAAAVDARGGIDIRSGNAIATGGGSPRAIHY
ncbi:MAG: hypothetical protein JWO65_845 [Sphingomonas bacterium]|jgi:hypothetical protein|nr:hypothetical protein [Sphingomonas bacterium]